MIFINFQNENEIIYSTRLLSIRQVSGGCILFLQPSIKTQIS